ncbi:MAG: DUF2119 domain-containing protein [Methanobacterium sp.]|uniref:DUF2119 domain-containing protein n=1 Tax=Methanobacterium sp. TaxID=2164 RepID=UPI003D6458E8|nr:DUF2119 domain-containing protein [Methanobacterium sp.]
MVYKKVIDKGEKPKRLFIGGVHGHEGLTTIKALSQISDVDVKNGNLTIYNFDESHYISTLDRHYYNLDMGKKIVSIIRDLKPEMYVELHCYNSNSFERLTDTNRKEHTGVPPLIHLEKGVLIGSISPYIRTSLFDEWDVCITLEIPCKPSKESMDVYLNVMRAVATSKDKYELLDNLRVDYSDQVDTAAKYAVELYWDGYPPL